MRVVTASAGLGTDAYRQVFETMPDPVLVVDPGGAMLAHNRAAAEVFGNDLERDGVRCCDLLSCGQGGKEQPLSFNCITVAALERDGALPPVEAEVNGRAADVVAAPLIDGAGAVLHIRLREATASVSAESLRVTTLGGLELERGGTRLDGDWLHHRPGQVLKYLICARGHRVPSEELIDTLWPDAERSAITNLRQAVHQLRDRLEPNRKRHVQSSYIVAVGGGYEFNLTHVRIDADEFETEARGALLSRERWGPDTARIQLERAARLYDGDFLADEPYAEWALAERDRLRALAATVLRDLAALHLDGDDVAPAASALQRLADLEPLDLDAQRSLIEVMLQQGRHADAARRYELVRRRFRRAFDREPGFALSELIAEPVFSR